MAIYIQTSIILKYIGTVVCWTTSCIPIHKLYKQVTADFSQSAWVLSPGCSNGDSFARGRTSHGIKMV